MKTPPATATTSETMTLNALLHAISDAARRAEDAFYNGGEAELTEGVERVMTLAGALAPHLDELRGTRVPMLKVTFPSVRTAGRCATDLRNRGFQVSGDLIGATLIVRTPEGWTGTPARPVIAAHGEHEIVTI